MRPQIIDLFMWGYQSHFRWSIEYLMQQVLKELGVEAHVRALVVGARKPGASGHPVCIEPEKADWPVSLFDGLLELVEVTYAGHPSQNLFFSDEVSMREKPEHIRQSSVTSAVQLRLKPFDKEHAVRSFCGDARPIDTYYVVAVIQLPQSLFEQFPPLPEAPPLSRNAGYPSLVHAAIDKVLEEAAAELGRVDPGRYVSQRGRNAAELAVQSARSFMYTACARVSRGHCLTDLFERFNRISSLFYEGTEGLGHVVLADQKSDHVDFVLRFKEPVALADSRWARKILQMATSDVAVIADAEYMYGLGRQKSGAQTSADVFAVHFLDHYAWELRNGDRAVIRCRYGVPQLPQAAIDRNLFLGNLHRIFPSSTATERVRLWDVLVAAADEQHGSMIVLAEDAAAEAERLSRQGTQIDPAPLTVELFQRVSGIDGSILVDGHGICHAIGVILDGPANDECKPSRGSRYNSGVRYVRSSSAKRLALVMSEDKSIDIVPRLRPRVSRTRIEQMIKALEEANVDNCHEPRNWLDSHRFYLSASQCARVNANLERLTALLREADEIALVLSPFKSDPDMEDSYLVD